MLENHKSIEELYLSSEFANEEKSVANDEPSAASDERVSRVMKKVMQMYLVRNQEEVAKCQ